MPVSKEQADMIAALAIAMRPHGASRWDAPGVVAAIGKVRHLSLADVVMAVARAAADRDAQNPGVLTNMKSPCWREKELRPEFPDTWDASECCAICSLPAGPCQAVADPGHEFITAAAHAANVNRAGYDTAAIVTDLRSSKEPMRPRDQADDTEPDPVTAERIAELKAALAGIRDEPTSLLPAIDNDEDPAA